LIDTKHAEVYPCRCDTDKCTYKQQWVDAGSPFRVPIEVALGKKYMPLVSEWIKTKYFNPQRGTGTANPLKLCDGICNLG